MFRAKSCKPCLDTENSTMQFWTSVNFLVNSGEVFGEVVLTKPWPIKIIISNLNNYIYLNNYMPYQITLNYIKLH